MTDSPSSPPPSGQRPSLSSELDDALADLDPSDVPTVFLVGLSGRAAGKLFKIRAGESLIGRSSHSFVCFDEKAVSHKHAQLKLDAMGCTIQDLESTNGTFLNDIRVTAPHMLHAGDVIRIGNNALGFLTDAEDEQQHTRAMARLTAPRLIGHTSAYPPPVGEFDRRSGAQIVPSSMSGPVVGQAPHALLPVVPEPEISALDNTLDKVEVVLRFVKSYRKVLLGGALLGLLAGAVVVGVRPPAATAEFEIYLRQDATPDPTRPQYESEFALQGREFFAFAERKFSDVDLILQTLRDVGEKATKARAAATAPQLAFTSVDRQGTFRGSFTAQDADFAEKFLAAHLQNFLEAEINKALAVHAGEVRLMQEELEKNEKELVEVEQKLRTFKEKHLHALPEHAMSQIQARGMLLGQRDSLMAAVTRYSGELNLARQQLSSEDAFVTSKVARSEPYTAALTEVKKKIAAAEAQGLAEGHPEIQKLRDEQRRLEGLKQEALFSQTTEIDRKSNPEQKRLHDRVGELTVALNASQKELEQVQGRLGEIEKISGKMPEVEADITQLARRQASAKQIHEHLHVELKAKELELQFERGSVAARYEIVEAPSAWQPTRLSMLVKWGGAGMAGGLVLGVLVALVHWLLKYARERKYNVAVPATSALARLKD